MSDRLPQTLRSDALDNRESILDAARALFSTGGLDVPMREIARRAGVGPATLYRRFPTKQALVAEAFADQLRACRTIVDEGCADPDPWRGLCQVIERICEVHARDRGFTEAFLAALPGEPDAAGRAYTVGALAGLARRAKDAGRLRSDFVLDDLILVFMANKGIRTRSTATQVAASRRFAGLAIQAFAAEPRPLPLPPAPRLAQTAPDSA
ncbi:MULTISPECIES: TetR/AcrR family transcriptional regulator [unclassified Streptomyces]|uniref:TetR/AcrR family transcriptional regulator n=1 Tax=unclassified Streptomyces TaxID=2593676 RepID=UPI0001C1B143|nr:MULTISPECIES: TetR/AcrR family transcriptional regulator [unclassified Streptomyces]AEN13555.1 transcriptional regulator, TetR family [Streptomyces sp. SirexAA-E]MYR65147.1 TetR family transcriptional regulator [Streptomyces sp. SID4939]MYR99759.1 TetR family transcriptional regulator [Streptomyces sp. SID4940]MYT66997.1 TetR family transcriptional regulator [Streptomyces sp. SID8357]MYT84641.1 TetR family transcriptional regulator [Streptomyces sp. SID8360]